MKTIRLSEYGDYSAFLPVGFTETTEATTIPVNTYAWNNTLKALRINDASASLKGCISVNGISNIKRGDVVEVKGEAMSISGERPKIALDFSTGGNLAFVQSAGSDGFQKFGGKFVATKDSDLIALVGLFTTDIGDYYIRNIEITYEGTDVGGLNELDRRAYVFKFLSSSLELRTEYHPYVCTTTVSNTEILITHSRQFGKNIYGSAVALVSGSAPEYLIAKTKSETRSSVIVRFYNMTTGALVDPTTLYGTNAYFSVIHNGYK